MTTTRIVTEVERHILDVIAEIRFGAVEVHIHDARVVQVERTEKTRFDIKKHSNT